MRTVRIIEHISLDGVIQAPGGPEEDTNGRFEHGGWAFPHHDEAVGEAIGAAHPGGFDLLLGRRTYDIFASHWPHQEGPMAEGLNGARKYVATHRPESLGWGPAEGLGADIAASLRKIKAGEGPDLVVWGSSTITPALIEHGLADEVVLLVFPVMLGRGKRIFSDTAAATELSLISSKAAGSGVIINIYKPAGPARTGSFAESAE
ncbi:deaminase-reductase domain-containing protein [Glycocaulis alkaliphilus]|uniref:Deaminase-reductase domain-containing protein n=1 Tax=Glycocaulis alkaliphilus TaxID=1434191 RepID=A0A3T0ECM7_9PROT|nr:dihydrofolate reductase family protein [Glycocaulis alkaliphilus]AZU05055.1 deaminase-reductase domain-containing protein [Glycocaulis alkaliphilus]GGB65604.1 dihydrofolate reductase [Glycocaulis alkaliphilus]